MWELFIAHGRKCTQKVNLENYKSWGIAEQPSFPLKAPENRRGLPRSSTIPAFSILTVTGRFLRRMGIYSYLHAHRNLRLSAH